MAVAKRARIIAAFGIITAARAVASVYRQKESARRRGGGR